MEAPMAAPVQADFRIMVLEASNVPKEYRSLVVSWKKGAKCVSTSPAAVHRNRAEWNEAIKVTTALCRVGQQVQFQAKFCWLQVASEDGTVVLHDKVNLAECCDGQVRDRTLQTHWKAQSSFVKLKITIQAMSSIFSPDEAVPAVTLPFRRSSSPRHRPSSSSAATSGKTPLRALSDLSPEVETPGRGTPGASPIQRGLEFRRQRGKSSLALGSQRLELDALEVVSQHASSTKDLAPRLMALCLRQLRASRLSATEQEEALQVFMVMLRRSREPSVSCGVLFSAVPVLRREDLAVRSAEADAIPDLSPEVSQQKAEAAASPLIPPSLYSSPLYLNLEADRDGENEDRNLSRPLEELQEHLTNIRNIALALAPPPAEEVAGPAQTAPSLQIVSAPVSPRTSVMGQSPSPSSAPDLSKDKATSWNSRTLEQNQGAPTLANGTSGTAAETDGMAKIEAVLATAVVVHQIVELLEMASSLGRQAGSIISALWRKLQELARDRELWIHRCLAEKELQYASSLCKKGVHERFFATSLPPGMALAACR